MVMVHILGTLRSTIRFSNLVSFHGLGILQHCTMLRDDSKILYVYDRDRTRVNPFSVFLIWFIELRVEPSEIFSIDCRMEIIFISMFRLSICISMEVCVAHASPPHVNEKNTYQ